MMYRMFALLRNTEAHISFPKIVLELLEKRFTVRRPDQPSVALRLPFLYASLLSLLFSATLSKADEWSIDDNIKVQHVLRDISTSDGAAQFGYSPQRDLVAYVTAKSDLERDLTVYTLRVHSVSGLNRFVATGEPPQPEFETSVASSGSDTAIDSVRWSPDGTALFFLSRELHRRTLMRWSRGFKRSETFLALDSDISHYEFVGEENVLVFALYPSPKVTEPIVVGREPLAEVIGIHSLPPTFRPHRMLISAWKGEARPRSYDLTVLPPPTGGFVLSHDGRHAAVAEQLQAEWTGRCWRHLHMSGADKDETKVFGMQVSVLDLETGHVMRPFSAPIPFFQISGAPRLDIAVWSADGSRAVVASSFTEGDRCNLDNPTIQRNPATYVFSLDGAREKVHDIGFSEFGEYAYGPKGVRWGDSGNNLILKMGAHRGPYFRHPGALDQQDRTVLFELKDGTWSQTSEQPESEYPPDAPATPALKLELRQNYNIPPAVFAVDQDGNARMLHDLAPHARSREFGRVEVIDWNDPAGLEWTGLLALPADHIDGQRLPLIVQTHDFRAGGFFTEGPGPTAYPGRAALARGFAVLTVNDTSNPAVIRGPRPDEGERTTNGYRLAIELLDRKGLIDPRRVGVIGWSRSSYYTKYALVHAPELFAAAVGVDGLDYGYFQLLTGLNWTGMPFPQQYEATYGGFFWQNIQTWLQRAPGFNLTNVSAPFRGESNSGVAQTLQEWEFYSGLRLLHKPADLVIYPGGEHSLVRPSHRKKSTQGSLDWLDYWINGYVDPDPNKSEQYKRWNALKEEHHIYYGE